MSIDNFKKIVAFNYESVIMSNHNASARNISINEARTETFDIIQLIV